MNLYLSYDAFLRSIKQNRDSPHSILLGAGASITSGVQTAYDCIWEWKKDIFLSNNPNAPEYYKNYKDERVQASIQKFLDNDIIFPDIGSPDEYSFYAEKAYPIAEDRRKYFQKLVEGKVPYIGYKLMCLLAEKGIVSAVWTTNFDGLIVKAAYLTNLTPVEITLDSSDRIFRNQSNREMLAIMLHGDFKYGPLKNTSKELDSQNDTFVETLSRYHADKNLVVMGYSGRDTSLMDALLKAFSLPGSGRLYWCGYGHTIPSEVESLISTARVNNREAYYIPTDGFDSTMHHLAKICFEGDRQMLFRVNEILKLGGEKEIPRTKFSLKASRTDKYIKSNIHPIVFPKEVFRFKFNYGDRKPWKFLKEIVKDNHICAIPYQGYIHALGTLSDINRIFSPNILGSIDRVPIHTRDISEIGVLKNLMLQATLKQFSTDRGISTNRKNKIWLEKVSRLVELPYAKITVHRALQLSLTFDRYKKFGYLAFTPSMFLKSENDIERNDYQNIARQGLEQLRNEKYNQYLDFWTTKLFPTSKRIFEYPDGSGTGFEFSISKEAAFAEIMVATPKYTASNPKNYNSKLTLHRGVEFDEPELIFTKKDNINLRATDFHPMRGLQTNRPWDYPLNGKIVEEQINLGVICNTECETKLSGFLNGLHKTHKASVNKAYLIDYPGFASAYSTPINIPDPSDNKKWMTLDYVDEAQSLSEASIKLVRLITERIELLSTNNRKLVVIIFIPKAWSAYKSFENNGEIFDLHDYIKAFSASEGISTQLIEEDTLEHSLLCQKYWWLSLSFYVKSFRTPWVIKNNDEDTAFAGIGYSIKGQGKEAEIILGCSHIYSSNGQGLKYKLSKIDDYTLDKKDNPFMSYDDSYNFGVSIRQLFYDSMDKLPRRVVVHKRTAFTNDEIRGITDSLKLAGVENIDLIEINYESDIRYLATKVFQGEMKIHGYAVSRGTCIVVNHYQALLWTHGIVPSVQNSRYNYYLGGKSIPAPLRITKHYGRTNINTIATEILGLTKMNWNSFNLYTKLPSTINSSNQIARIGKLLSLYEGRNYDYRLFI